MKIATVFTAFAIGASILSYQNVTPSKVDATQHTTNYAEYTYSGSYYDGIDFDASEGMNGNLRKSLTSLIVPKGFYIYGSSGTDHLATQLQYADEDPTNSSNMVYLYTRDSVKKNSAQTWNREHVWPQSLSNGNWGTSQAGTDLLHLRPTYNDTNSKRGNKLYGYATGSKTTLTYNGMTYGYTSGNYFEPLDSVKGDVARIIMYLWVTYTGYSGYSSLSITSVFRNFDTLLEWHTLDRPDLMEGERNDYVQTSKQKNRNPFVDHPELAWKIFGDSCSDSVKDACVDAYPENNTPIEPTGISLSTTSTSISQGKTFKLNAFIEPSGATGSITWTSSELGVASVDNNGLVTAQAFGTATITATVGVYSASCEITVTEYLPDYGTEDNPLSVSDAIAIIVENGGIMHQPLYVKGIVCSNTIYTGHYYNVWLKSEEGLDNAFVLKSAVLDSSLSGMYIPKDSLVGYEIVAYGPGKFDDYLDAFSLGETEFYPESPVILSVDAPTATNIELDKTAIEMVAGNITTLTATLTPGNSGSLITWESSDESVATVNNGVVTGVAAGTATITARVDEADIEAECVVTVTTSSQSIGVELTNSIIVGDTVLLGSSVVKAQYEGPSNLTENAYGQCTYYEDNPDPSIYPLEVCEGTIDDSFALKIISGEEENKYLAYSGSKNSLRVTDTLDDSGSWYISFDGSKNATIQNAAETSRVVWWNNSSPRFACYTTQNDFYYNVNLWKVTVSAPSSPEECLTNCSSYAKLNAHVETTPGNTATITKTIAEMSGAPASGTQIDHFDLDANITASVNANGDNGKVYLDGTQWRVYQSSGGIVTISSSAGAITSVTFAYVSQNTGILKYGNNTVESEVPFTISSPSSSVSFQVGNSDESVFKGQARITSISVTYGETGTTTVDTASLLYGEKIPVGTWNTINDSWGITDYGIMVFRTEPEYIGTVKTVKQYFELDPSNVSISHRGHGNPPTATNGYYDFAIKINVQSVSNYDRYYVAAPFIVAGGEYYFLDQVSYSVNTLADYYLTNGGSELSTAALQYLAETN